MAFTIFDPELGDLISNSVSLNTLLKPEQKEKFLARAKELPADLQAELKTKLQEEAQAVKVHNEEMVKVIMEIDTWATDLKVQVNEFNKETNKHLEGYAQADDTAKMAQLLSEV